MNRITTILKQYISERIPQKATNIFFQMFNGIEAMFTNLEYRLDIFKRERNMLTAQNISSLRNLASQNGYEPKLRVPANGILMLKISPKLYNRVGFPLFIKPYSVFTNKISKLNYYYISDRTIRLSDNNYYIPVIEGLIKTQTEKVSDTISSETIKRFYLPENKVANNSIMVECNGEEYLEVGSFYDNMGINDNKQFMVKFSNNSDNPIIIYVKGLESGDVVTINYRLTNGELGNLDRKYDFETESIVDSYGSYITPSDDELQIVNVSGFTLGSNGTDENALRSAIGYNHGINLLFDNISYRNFLSKYSTLLVQDIDLPDDYKQINNIYVWKRQSLNPTENVIDVQKQYRKFIDYKTYILSDSDKINLDKTITEFEYCLSSHNLFNPIVNHYAVQITFDNIADKKNHIDNITIMLYEEFGKFLYVRHHEINMESLFDDYREKHNISCEYMIFNRAIEKKKLEQKTEIETPYIIRHTIDTTGGPTSETAKFNGLPLLRGDFNICDSEYNSEKLFFDINTVVKN